MLSIWLLCRERKVLKSGLDPVHNEWVIMFLLLFLKIGGNSHKVEKKSVQRILIRFSKTGSIEKQN
jgi:hypothetical protein